MPLFLFLKKVIKKMKNLKFILFAFVFIFSTFISAAFGMEELTNKELGELSAGNILYALKVSNSGVSISIDGTLKITDSDLVNAIEFKNLNIDNGAGQGFSFNTPEAGGAVQLYFMPDTEGTASRYLVFEVPDLSANINLPHINLESITFCDLPLGSLSIEDIALSGYRHRLDLFPEGSGLLHQDILIGLSLGKFAYIYNDIGDELSFNSINLSQTASGDPADPLTWTFSGPLAIGDIDESTPISIETNYENPVPYAQIDLPVNGTVRIENVSMGASDFGPAAIDGIQMHSFYVRVPGAL